MNNLENKIQSLKENYSNSDQDVSLREYAEGEAESDPNFFRWLFSTDLDEDFDTSLSPDQKSEYQDFLNRLT